MPAGEAAASIVHEALTNVLKHAGARSIVVSIAFGRKKFRLSVRDDGRGLAAVPNDDAGVGHMGLVGMRERATEIGATLRVSSTPGRGTVVRLDVPFGR